MLRAVWVVLVASCASCVGSQSNVCLDGTVCPSTSTCVERADATWTCATDEQRAACDPPKADGDPCTFGDNVLGTCRNGVCLPSDLRCGNGIIDVTLDREEQCDDGNAGSHDGCSSTCSVEGPRWQQVLAGTPGPRARHAMTYDSNRGHTVLVAGQGNTLHDDLWEYDGRGWRRNATGFGPSTRRDHAIAYDRKRRRIVLFGGINMQLVADTWEWDGAAWSRRLPLMTPSARRGHVMFYDPVGSRVVLFGGRHPDSRELDIFNDTWVWNGDALTWTRETHATAPSPRANAAAAYDPVRNRLVLFGGVDHSGTMGTEKVLGDTWVYDGTWTQVPGPAPSARTGATLTYVPGRGMLLLGGTDLTSRFADAHVFDGEAWAPEPSATLPLARAFHAATYDHARREVVMYGGEQNGNALINGAIRFRDGAWQAPDLDTAPPGRLEHAVAYDAANRRILAHSAATLPSRTFELANGWRAPFNGGDPSFDPDEHGALALDGAGRLVLFDARGLTWIGTRDPVAENWVWLKVPSPTSPPARTRARLVYDARRDRIVMFGGSGEPSGTALGDTWEFDGSTWTLITSTATPPKARFGAALAFDPVAGRIVMFGGGDLLGNYADGTFAYDGVTWTQLAAFDPAGPQPRGDAGMAWDAERRRLVLFGGAFKLGDEAALNDTWELDQTGEQPLWVRINASGPPATKVAAMTTSPDGGVMVLTAAAGLVETWQLRWDAVVGGADDLCAAPTDLDGDQLVGCKDPDCWHVCRPECRPGDPCDGDGLVTCGDGTCDAYEDCRRCADDCGACNVCGDGICEAGETCLGDCPP